MVNDANGKIAIPKAAQNRKDALESEGLPCRILPEQEISKWSETGSFVLYLPKGREHVGEEIVRKL